LTPHGSVWHVILDLADTKKKTRERRSRITQKQRETFLDELALTCDVTHSASCAGEWRQRFYELREKDAEFAQLWEEAEAKGISVLEAEMRRRAIDGVDEPVFHKGMVCGHIRKYSDTLLIFALKGHAPKKYRERLQMSGDKEEPLEHKHFHELTNEQLEAIASRALPKPSEGE